MSGCGVVPSPANFELFYAHAAGEVSAVSHAIGEMLEKRKAFTPEILAHKVREVLDFDS